MLNSGIMKLRLSLRQFLIALTTLTVATAVIGFLYQRSYVRRAATLQLLENGFTLAYDRSSVERGWRNEGFGGHRAVDKPPNSILDLPDRNWLSTLGMWELTNQIEVVDGRRTWLDKQSFDGFKNDDLEPLARLSGVKEVALNWNTINDEGLKYVSGLSRLTRLELDGCPISDQGLKHLGDLTNIQHLSLAFTKLTDDGIPELRKLKKLECLSLEGTNVTSGVLTHLNEFKNLKTLNLSSTKIGQANIERISQLSNLEELYLADTAVSDLDLFLRDLSNLRWLVVDDTSLDDNLIDSLKGMQLDGLSVARTNVSEKSIDMILALKLKKFFSGYETGLTSEQLNVIEEDIAFRRSAARH